MPTLETLSEADLDGLFTTSSRRRARKYIARVQGPTRQGRVLRAQVYGNRLYDVEVDVDRNGIHARCSCPYDWGGYCKHIGAVLLKWIQDPRSFAVLEEGEKPAPPTDFPIEVVPIEPPRAVRPPNPPFWLARPFAERRAADRGQLEEWLTKLKVADLRRMARQRGWKLKGTRKADLVHQIVEQMFETANVRQAIQQLDREHRQVFRALAILSGGEEVFEQDLERVAGMWGALTSYKQIRTYVHHLANVGLALPGEVTDYYAAVGFIPVAMLRHFPPPLEDVVPGTEELQVEGNARGLALAEPDELLKTAHQLIMLFKQSPLALRPPLPRPRLERFYDQLKGWDYDPQEIARLHRGKRLSPTSDLHLTVPPPLPALPDEEIQRLAPLAGGEEQLDFIYHLLVAAGLLWPGSPITVWTENLTQFLRRSEEQQWAILARAYFSVVDWSALWDLLRSTPELSLRRSWRYSRYTPEHLYQSLRMLRQRLLHVLACLPDDRWIMLSDLFAIMRFVWPRFDSAVRNVYRSRPQEGAWYLARKSRPLREKNRQDWDLAQGGFIRQVLTGPLHRLGLADLYYDGGEPVAFRLHGLADLYLDRSEAPPLPRRTAPPPRPAEDAMTVEGLRITVNPAAVSAQAHSLLDKIARLEETNVDRFVYRLDAQATYESFESGASLSQLLADWEQLLPLPLPEAIRQQLTAWWEAYGQVRIYRDITVIELSDDYALAEMKAITDLEKYLIAEISPRLVLIQRKAIPILTAQLERAGYTPKQAEGV